MSFIQLKNINVCILSINQPTTCSVLHVLCNSVIYEIDRFQIIVSSIITAANKCNNNKIIIDLNTMYTVCRLF